MKWFYVKVILIFMSLGLFFNYPTLASASISPTNEVSLCPSPDESANAVRSALIQKLSQNSQNVFLPVPGYDPDANYDYKYAYVLRADTTGNCIFFTDELVRKLAEINHTTGSNGELSAGSAVGSHSDSTYSTLVTKINLLAHTTLFIPLNGKTISVTILPGY